MSTGDILPDPPSCITGSSVNSSSQLTTAESFKRCIKCDYSHFTNFKEWKCRDNWTRNTIATARYQGADDFLKPEYAPLNQEDMNLFNEKKKFMQSMFSTTLQTKRGKKFVREYEEDFDTQAVYKKLCEFWTTSVGVRVSASDILSFITSAKFESWKGTIESFILNCQD